MHQRQQMGVSTADTQPANDGRSEPLPELLRRSLHGVLADERYDDSDEAELRIALRAVCDRARRDGVRAEHLLVVLKESWRELPKQPRLQRPNADEALARVVSACINEYYEDRKVRTWDATARCIQEADRIRTSAQGGEGQ